MAYDAYGQYYEDPYLGANDPNNPNGYYGETAPPPAPPPSPFPTPIPMNPNPPPASTQPPAGQTADPWASAPTDGNWQAWFLRNVQGLAPTPQSLAGLEAKLTPHGISVLRNAQGVAGKIRLPNGRIVDVGRSFSGGDTSAMGWQWNEGDGSEGGGAGPSINPEYLTPFTEAQPGLPTSPTLDLPEFEAPTAETILQDPSYQFRLDQGRGALENSAAAKGVLNSGGTLQGILDYGQKAGSQEWANAWGRQFDLWNANSNNKLTEFRARKDVTDTDYNRGWEQFLDRKSTHYANQNNPWSKILGAAQVGAR